MTTYHEIDELEVAGRCFLVEGELGPDGDLTITGLTEIYDNGRDTNRLTDAERDAVVAAHDLTLRDAVLDAAQASYERRLAAAGRW